MGRLEQVEQLEQLRALEHGIPIRVVEVSLQGRTVWSVDNPQDVARVEEIIAREGELV
jgi:3-deoxy-manno-octulosonate cytidylyltransferase (CMP-KDO synthetase)